MSDYSDYYNAVFFTTFLHPASRKQIGRPVSKSDTITTHTHNTHTIYSVSKVSKIGGRFTKSDVFMKRNYNSLVASKVGRGFIFKNRQTAKRQKRQNGKRQIFFLKNKFIFSFQNNNSMHFSS